MILSAALDLGTTRIKGALLNEKGELSNFVSVAAPPITGAGLKRESSPSSYAEKAEKVVQELYKKTPNSIPLGIATQRSSFLLWEKETSRPITPLISWMDRRAFK
ncbi:MAG: FGGY family carbohydrate kinase, partial [Nitrospinota bacterium]